jgi:hypothetical protein
VGLILQGFDEIRKNKEYNELETKDFDAKSMGKDNKNEKKQSNMFDSVKKAITTIFEERDMEM